MKIEEIAEKQGVLRKFYDIVLETEYENTMDGDWASENGCNGFEAMLFNSFSEREKMVYALSHAKLHVHELLNMEVEEFINFFGYQYDWIISLEGYKGSENNVQDISTIEELYQLYKEKLFSDGVSPTLNYSVVDDFYAHLGYDLGLNHVLNNLNISGTSDLQEEFINLYIKDKENKMKLV